MAPLAGLTIGVLLDRARQERWVVESIRQAAAIPAIRLEVIACADADAAPSIGERSFALFDRLAEPANRRRSPLFAATDVAAEFAVRRLAIRIAGGRDGWWPDAASLSALRDCGVDVWLCFARTRPSRPLDSIARQGVWGLEIGAGLPAANPWAGAGEVAAAEPLTQVAVVDYAGSGTPLLYRSPGSTQRESARRNRLQALAKGLAFPRRLLERQLRQSSGEAVQALREESAPTGTDRLRATLPRVAALASRMIGTRLAARLPALTSQLQWQVAYQVVDDSAAECRFERLRYLVPPRDRFWADPFAVQHDDRQFIFMEELPYATQRGRLVAVEVSPDGVTAGPVRPVLERPYHLSYPFVFGWQGSQYLMPETAANRTVEVYRCEEFPHRWQPHAVLLENISAFDATLWRQDERWWMFVNVAEPGASPHDELHLYWSESPLGPWRPHRANPVVSDVRSARPAGPLFSDRGVLYRPSQDSALAYGHSVVINRVDRLDETAYRETPVRRIAPDWRPDIRRVHTFGGTPRLRVVDCMVARSRW